ncbi:peptidoglycan endopeptidase [Mycobacterium sp. 012931]|uniref:peptidoglycan endopeptidase n=1 Tax=Mycobacterium sp. 012931 TaxID=1187065 RepID=UPI001267C975
MISATNFDFLWILSVASVLMIALATLLTLINQVSGTPYIVGGDSPAGTDCSGLASWVSNAATDRPIFGDRFNTGNEEAALAARGFQHGTAPNALVIGWNGRHTAVTLPDGTSVSSGEGGGVRVGGGGAYQAQFTHHMYLPMDEDMVDVDLPAPEDPPAQGTPEPCPPAVEDVVNPDELPPPPEDPGPFDDLEISNT